MQIKQQILEKQVQKQILPLYIITGKDNYLLEHSLTTIKLAIKKNHDYDEKIISIRVTEDWNKLREEANSYSLFSELVVLNVFFDKKSMDAAGKKIVTEYLNSINSRCFIIIRAPNIPAKQLLWLSSHEHAAVVIASPLSPMAMKSWIAMQLQKNSLHFESKVPDLINQYTHGNMLACAQLIEKITLSSAPNSKIDIQQVQEHLSDQCEHELFELIDACLLGQSDKAIQIIRHAANNKTEATLVLWMLCQEIRLIMKLTYFMEQNMAFQDACNQLKIWPSRNSLYQKCCNRFNKTVLLQLHRYCYLMDERIKSNLNTHIWSALENIALSLCSGDLCIA